MTIQEIITAYINLLWHQFQYDVNMLSKPWMYWAIFIPAIFYSIFFVIKWTLLTMPIWLPIKHIVYGFTSAIAKTMYKKQ